MLEVCASALAALEVVCSSARRATRGSSARGQSMACGARAARWGRVTIRTLAHMFDRDWRELSRCWGRAGVACDSVSEGFADEILMFRRCSTHLGPSCRLRKCTAARSGSSQHRGCHKEALENTWKAQISLLRAVRCHHYVQSCSAVSFSARPGQHVCARSPLLPEGPSAVSR